VRAKERGVERERAKEMEMEIRWGKVGR